jgi:ABC-type cobalamin/Fe3+-siderophores transport system ATPase subunit
VEQPVVEMSGVSFYHPESQTLVFNRLSLEVPAGVTTLVGQNGAGKSTFLLLAAGLLHPVEGTVRLLGMDTASLGEEQERQRWVSFIYQNMEFETNEPIGDLMEYVHAHGFLAGEHTELVEELVGVCELEPVKGRRLQNLSKGELQRAIIAFSVLYGSRVLMMDEPIFALEDHQKTRIMDFLVRYVHERQMSLLYSVHELELSRQYSDHLLLFRREGAPEIGPTAELFTRENIEDAYQVPFTMLKARERLFRRFLLDHARPRRRRR